MSVFLPLYPLVLVDTALFSVDDEGLKVLLVRRAEEPEIRKWALPGGMLKPHEDTSLESAARRILRDKISVELPHLEEVCTASGPDRDPRGWSISVLFFALLPRDQVQAVVKSKVEAVEWANVANLGHRIAFDHEALLERAVGVLRDRVERSVLPLHLMPEHFTLTQLQRTCETVLGRPLDKSVFRRRLKGSSAMVELDEFERGAQRPAQLFRATEGFSFFQG